MLPNIASVHSTYMFRYSFGSHT